MRTESVSARHFSATEILIVSLALLVRVALLLFAHGLHFQESRFPDYYSFSNETTNIAESIATGHGFSSPFLSKAPDHQFSGPTAWVAPVYPYFIGAVFRAFGIATAESFLVILMMQCLFSALTCVPMIRIGELTVGRTNGVIAALIWAIFPWFSKWAVTWLWEMSLSALLLALLFWYTLRLQDESPTRRWIQYGALWGIALLVNPALLTVLPIALGWCAWYRRRDLKPWLPKLGAAVVACFLVVSPWLARNRLAFGDWVFIRSNFGFELTLSNYPNSPGWDFGGRHPMGNLRELAHYYRVGEGEYVRLKTTEARRFILGHPSDFLLLTGKRIVQFWKGTALAHTLPVAGVWMAWSFAPLSLASLVALYIAVRRRVHAAGLFGATILLYPLPYYIAFGQVRYRHAVEPMMLLVIAYAAAEIFKLTTSRTNR